MKFKHVPADAGIQPDELNALLEHGWVCMGVLPITSHRGGIATPGDPIGGMPRPTLVFVMLEPSIPAGVVAQALVQLGRKTVTVEEVANKWFGTSLINIERGLNASNDSNQVESPGQTTPPV